MRPLLLKNAYFIDSSTFEIKKTNIVVHRGKNQNIDFITDYKSGEYEVVDLQGKIVSEAFVVGHHHIYSALAVGMPPLSHTPHNFYEILKYLWWNLDKKLDEDMIRASAYAVAISAIRKGNAYIIDHHSSPFAIKNSLNIIAEVLDEMGLNYLLAYEISDRDGENIKEKALEETERFLADNQGLIGLHASFTLEDETLKAVADMMEKFNTGIHIHIAEDRFDQDLTLMYFGKTVLERLNYYGLLNTSKSILAHGIHLFENDKKIFMNSPAFLVQNPESNQNNNVGFLDASGLGENIMLGTDGMHSDMIRSAHVAYFAGKKYGNPSMSEVYKRLTNNWRYLRSNSFDGIGKNNLVIFDYQPTTPITSENFLSHFFFGMDSSMIWGLIVNGEILMQDRRLKNIDIEEITKFTQQQAIRLWNML